MCAKFLKKNNVVCFIPHYLIAEKDIPKTK